MKSKNWGRAVPGQPDGTEAWPWRAAGPRPALSELIWTRVCFKADSPLTPLPAKGPCPHPGTLSLVLMSFRWNVAFAGGVGKMGH